MTLRLLFIVLALYTLALPLPMPGRGGLRVTGFDVFVVEVGR